MPIRALALYLPPSQSVVGICDILKKNQFSRRDIIDFYRRYFFKFIGMPVAKDVSNAVSYGAVALALWYSSSLLFSPKNPSFSFCFGGRD